MKSFCARLFSSSTINNPSLNKQLLPSVPLSDIKSIPAAQPTKQDIEEMKGTLNTITNRIEEERIRLQDIEDNKSRCKKKSFWAKFVAPVAMLIPATYKLVTASNKTPEAEKQITTDLVPTCQGGGNPMWPDSDGRPVIYNIIDICANNLGYKAASNRQEECEYWSSPNTGIPPFQCSYDICMNICSFARTNIGDNNWNGGWLVFGATLAGVAGYCLSGLFVKLDEVPLAKASKKLFSTEPFGEKDSPEKICLWLEKDEKTFASMTLGQVKLELEKKLNSARVSQLRKSYASTDKPTSDDSLSADSKANPPKKVASPG